MEFFEEIKISNWNESDLKKLLTIKNLPKLCQSINTVILDKQQNGIIYCIWGEFEINREELKNGIRFTLPNCHNGFAWTITIDTERNQLLIHGTINKREHDEDFIASIEQFIKDWSNGLAALHGT